MDLFGKHLSKKIEVIESLNKIIEIKCKITLRKESYDKIVACAKKP